MSAAALFGGPASPEADGAILFDDVVRFVRRFVVLSKVQLVAIALWIVHTHAIDAANATLYLNITSPEKRSGKTRLLEVLELLIARPWYTGRTSAAALVREIDDARSTLLLDEGDAAFKSDREYSEALRGILNAGHRRAGVPIWRLDGKPAKPPPLQRASADGQRWTAVMTGAFAEPSAPKSNPTYTIPTRAHA